MVLGNPSVLFALAEVLVILGESGVEPKGPAPVVITINFCLKKVEFFYGCRERNKPSIVAQFTHFGAFLSLSAQSTI